MVAANAGERVELAGGGDSVDGSVELALLEDAVVVLTGGEVGDAIVVLTGGDVGDAVVPGANVVESVLLLPTH